MSIAVNIYYSGTDGNAKKFAAAIRNEEGNLRMGIYFFIWRKK